MDRIPIERFRELDADQLQALADLADRIEDSDHADAIASVGAKHRDRSATRRELLAGAGAIGAGAILGGAATGSASASHGGAQVGTTADPVDVTAVDLIDQNGNTAMNLPGDGSVSIEDVDVGTSDFVSTGDFVGMINIGPTTDEATTTSTSYVDLGILSREIQWDRWLPSDAQSAFIANISVSTSVGDIRLRNTTDAENVFEELETGRVNTGPTNYTPTTQNDFIELQLQAKDDAGDQTGAIDPVVDLGVQL